ncbi:MAG: hypothetical protein WBB01_01585 [Phormidesmis sp.]
MMFVYPIYRAVYQSALTSAVIVTTGLLTISCSQLPPVGAEGPTAAASELEASEQSPQSSSSAQKGVSTNHDIYHARSLEVPAGTPVPAVTVQVEADQVSGWNLYVGTANFTFTPESVNDESSLSEGHGDLYINDKPIQRVYSRWTHLPELPHGKNEIRVTLNANGHETLTTQGNPIEDTVTIEVYNPGEAPRETDTP